MKTKLSRRKIFQAIFMTIAAYLLMSLILWLFVIKNKINDYSVGTIISYYVYIAIIFVALLMYVFFVDKENIRHLRKLGAIYLVLILSFVITFYSCMINCNFAPFAMCTLILVLLVGVKSAVFSNVLLIFIMFSTGFIFDFYDKNQLLVCLFVGLTTLTIAAFATKNHTKRINYVWTALAMSGVAVVSTTIIYLMLMTNTFVFADYIIQVSFSLGGGILNVMLMFLFVPLLERLFNITTDFRLAELTNTNQPLLKRLFNEAPGTFNHSLTVANYAEACAMAIGENTYLARAVGYYHDIGKLRNPVYFSENQRDGYNPHNEIAPEVSVSFLKNHIVYGISLVRSYRLPLEIEKAIVEHHGTFVMRFFYLKAKQYTEGELAVKNYCYDGPTPTTKIDGILMIVDACEATLRSLAVTDRAKAESVVEGLVKERMEFGQFDNCDLTMKEIDIIKQTIITTFMGTRHERVKYPELKLFNDIKDESTQSEA